MSDDGEMRFSAQEYGALLEWMMVSDPFPLPSSRESRLKRMLDAEARVRGYEDWVAAYHDFHGDTDE